MKAALLGVVLAIAVLLPPGRGPEVTPHASEAVQELPRIAWNDNLEAAGRLDRGRLELELEIVEGMWHVLGDGEPGGRVFAFREVGGEALNPGPMIRVPLRSPVHIESSSRLRRAFAGRGLRGMSP